MYIMDDSGIDILCIDYDGNTNIIDFVYEVYRINKNLLIFLLHILIYLKK